ncbi:MAG TPA: hypothetical protein VGV40_09635 [Solirubrobacteraceae bacterium]|nr:hypothetical protein [Solirubrobacteraceae bacterium]
MRSRRWALFLVTVTAAVVAGCGVTTSSFRCQNADCRITLSGSGADAELDSQRITIVLDAVADDTATLEVVGEQGGPDETVELAEGESGEVLGVALTVERIDGDEVVLRTRRS